MFSLLWEAIIGLIVGALAKFIMPGKDPGGIFITMLIGVAGALLATFIGSHVGLYKEGQRAGFIMSLLGAIVLLAIYRLIKGKTATAPNSRPASLPGPQVVRCSRAKPDRHLNVPFIHGFHSSRPSTGSPPCSIPPPGVA